ncbi:MAG: rRNA pseudouridine synthase [Phycisphaeraceae bacterium]|nr:MAG: rRNA pseudouridine synthase [Phycisphaeraceae bacterium]
MPQGDSPSHESDPLRDASRGIRLQKALADAGIASRRRCEELIEEGLVTVNGRLVTELPAWVDPVEDEIAVDGRVIARPAKKAGGRRLIYVMLYKPKNTLSAASDPSGRRTVADLVRFPGGVRLFPVGRLDYDTVGLILLTNDGEMANLLTHPRYGVHKLYRATVRGRVADEDLSKLEEGVYLAERKAARQAGRKKIGAKRTAHVGISIVKRDAERTVLELKLEEGRNRQVRRMFASVGHPVRKLIRVGMGPVRLTGLRVGEWRELTRDEVSRLRKTVDQAARKVGKTELRDDEKGEGQSRRKRDPAG